MNSDGSYKVFVLDEDDLSCNVIHMNFRQNQGSTTSYFTLLASETNFTFSGRNLIFTDSVICNPDSIEYDNITIAYNSLQSGPGEGHSTCLYGPYDDRNKFIRKEFKTEFNHDTQISINIQARIWFICKFMYT